MHLTPHLETHYGRKCSATYMGPWGTHHQDRPRAMERKSVIVLLAMLVLTSDGAIAEFHLMLIR